METQSAAVVNKKSGQKCKLANTGLLRNPTNPTFTKRAKLHILLCISFNQTQDFPSAEKLFNNQFVTTSITGPKNRRNYVERRQI